MEQKLIIFFEHVSNIVWGWPVLVLLVGTGIYLTILLKGLQFRGLIYSFYLAFIKRKETDAAQGDSAHSGIPFWRKINQTI